MMRPRAHASHWHTGTCARRLTSAALCLAPPTSADATPQMAAVKPARPGFLGADYALLTPGETAKGQAGLRDFNPAAQWRQYRKIFIEPATCWGDEASQVAPSDQPAPSS